MENIILRQSAVYMGLIDRGLRIVREWQYDVSAPTKFWWGSKLLVAKEYYNNSNRRDASLLFIFHYKSVPTN